MSPVVGGPLERKKERKVLVESLKAKHARLQLLIFDDIVHLGKRGRSQFFSEMLLDRKHPRFHWVNIEAQLLYTPDNNRYKQHVDKAILKEFVETKKKLKWWKEANQRLFLNGYGNFFRDDSQLRVWAKNYRIRRASQGK